jgi:hypothetical protein
MQTTGFRNTENQVDKALARRQLELGLDQRLM